MNRTQSDLAVLVGICLFVWLGGTAMSYAWLRAVHSPLRPSQKRLLMFFFLLFAAAPVLAPLYGLALRSWQWPETPTTVGIIVGAMLWLLTCLVVVGQLSKPGRILNRSK